MQYLVLLPGLALVDRGELFIQSRTEPAQNDTQNDTQTILKSFQKRPGWSTGHKTGGQVDVGSML